jgi:endoglucanase
LKRLLALILLCWPLQAEAAIALKRGIALDIWTTWPAEADWLAPGFLDTFPEWRKTVGPEKIALIKRAGFDFVRLPIDPAPFLWKPDAKRTRRLVAQTLETVELLKASGLKVIVDMHAIPAGEDRKTGTDQILKPKLFEAHKRLVAEMASALAGQDPDEVAFEVFNEPTNDCGGGAPKWPAMAKSLHRAARENAPALTLVIQGGCWGGAEGLAKLKASDFADENILWSFHTYEPFLVTHQGASWTGGTETYVSGLRFPPESMTPAERAAVRSEAVDRIKAAKLPQARTADLIEGLDDDLGRYFSPGWAEAALAKPFDTVAAWAAANAVPADRVFLGEFGMIKADLAAETRIEDRASAIKAIRETAEAHGFSWSVWSHGGSFAVTAGDDSRLFEPLILEALGL